MRGVVTGRMGRGLKEMPQAGLCGRLESGGMPLLGLENPPRCTHPLGSRVLGAVLPHQEGGIYTLYCLPSAVSPSPRLKKLPSPGSRHLQEQPTPRS